MSKSKDKGKRLGTIPVAARGRCRTLFLRGRFQQATWMRVLTPCSVMDTMSFSETS